MWGRPVGVAIGCDAAQELESWDVKHFIKPNMPFFEKIPSALYSGRTIIVEAECKKNSFEFAVDFYESTDLESDILFHFNARFDRKIVVRNHRRRGSWGREEIATDNSFPFTGSCPFKLQFFVWESQFLVSVDGRHHCKYKMKLPVETAKFLRVRGDVQLHGVHIQNCDIYPDRSLIELFSPSIVLPKNGCAPVDHSIERNEDMIVPGTTITLIGRVKLMPQQFYVNLQISASVIPHPVIPLHINLRLCQPGLLEEQMILNSWVDGSWGHELKPDSCPFLPGMNFIMKIKYFDEGFHLSVNGDYLTAFPLRFSTPPAMDTVLVQGDVIIESVKVNKSSLKTIAD